MQKSMHGAFVVADIVEFRIHGIVGMAPDMKKAPDWELVSSWWTGGDSRVASQRSIPLAQALGGNSCKRATGTFA
jgi:hypothetical protein